MKGHDEISRFSANGKTFFFNRMRARNDAEFLSINCLYGKNGKQRLTLFPSQMLDFYKHFVGAMRDMTGMAPNAGAPTAPKPPRLPIRCPACKMGSANFELTVLSEDDSLWLVDCKCGESIFNTGDYNG